MKAIALLGRQDEPTDGVADYCSFLAQSLRRGDIELEVVRVPWAESGWISALRWLSLESTNWRGRWVLLQYTGLAWSRRGFPFGVLAVQWLLQRRGTLCAVVFHDVKLINTPRIRDRLRRRCLRWIMRRLLDRSKQSIVTAPLETLPWIPQASMKAKFIPIGANIPEVIRDRSFTPVGAPKTIGVFCITGGANQKREVAEILAVAERVKRCVPALRLEAFGRGTEEAIPLLEGPLRKLGVECRLRGVLPAEEITRTLQSVDVLLYVRSELITNRGSALAAIACGVPVVAFGQCGMSGELDAAGIEFVPWGSLDSLAHAVIRVLTDSSLWQELHERCRRAQSAYFSWSAVSDRYVELLTANGSQE